MTKIDENVPANCVAATGGHVEPLVGTPPGITALQKLRNAATRARKKKKKRK